MILIYINSFLFVLLFLFILYSYFPPTSSYFYTMILRNVSSIWENIQRRRLNLFLRIYHACDKSFSKVYSVIRWDISQNSNQNNMFIRERGGGGISIPLSNKLYYLYYFDFCIHTNSHFDTYHHLSNDICVYCALLYWVSR